LAISLKAAHGGKAMSAPTYSSSEAAEQIGVSPSTIKNWVVRLPVPFSTDGEGTKRFAPEALQLLETVKRLREDERSYATIRRVIGPEPTAAAEAPRATAPLNPASGTAPVPPPEGRAPAVKVAEAVSLVRPMWNAIQSEQATAARRITRLEAKVDELLKERVALIAELDAVQQRLNVLEEGRYVAWWRRLFFRRR